MRFFTVFFDSFNLLYLGGGERWLIDVANELARRGHVVLVLTSDCEREARILSGDVQKELNTLFKFKWERVSLFKLGKFKFILPLRLPYLIHVLRNADLVYFMDIGEPLLPILSAIAGRCTIIGLHGGLGAFLLHSASREGILSLIVKLYLRLLQNLNVKLHALTKTQHRSALTLGVSNCVHFPLRIDCRRLAAEPRDENVFAVLFVGRLLTRVKGLDILYEVVHRTAPFHQDLKFVIVGKGGDGEELVKALARKFPNVEWIGFITNNRKLASVYAEASLFLSTSRVETYGLALIEALVSGLPCVTTPTPLAREVITGDFGVVVSYEPEKIAREIIRYHSYWEENRGRYIQLRKKIASEARRKFCLNARSTALGRFCGSSGSVSTPLPALLSPQEGHLHGNRRVSELLPSRLAPPGELKATEI